MNMTVQNQQKAHLQDLFNNAKIDAKQIGNHNGQKVETGPSQAKGPGFFGKVWITIKSFFGGGGARTVAAAPPPPPRSSAPETASDVRATAPRQMQPLSRDPVKTARGQGTIAAQLSGAYHADIFNAKVDEKLKNSGLVGSDEAKLKGKLYFNPRDTAQNTSSPLYSSIQEGIAKEVLQNGLKVMEGANLTEVAKNKALEYAGATIDEEINNFKNHSRGVPPMKSIPEASEKAENKPDLPTFTKDQISSLNQGFVGKMPGGPY